MFLYNLCRDKSTLLLADYDVKGLQNKKSFLSCVYNILIMSTNNVDGFTPLTENPDGSISPYLTNNL
jgi:hypothetical protein